MLTEKTREELFFYFLGGVGGGREGLLLQTLLAYHLRKLFYYFVPTLFIADMLIALTSISKCQLLVWNRSRTFTAKHRLTAI